MQNFKPFVSIVIPAFNAGPTLSQTVRACMDQDYPKDKFEIIVVDDGSDDNTRDVAAGFNVRYIYQKKSGPASARNNGWRNSKGEAVCFTDADCIPESDWISKLVRHYNADNTGAVAGSYSVHGSPYLLDKFVHYEIQDRHSRMPEHISSFGTYNVMIKRAVLEATAGFNPEYYKASGEDTDLSYKITGAGYKIYFAKDASVSHKNILRLWKYLIVQFRHGYWRMKLYRGNISKIAGDEYGYWKDFLEVPLAIALIFSLFFGSGYRAMLTAGLFLIQLPLAVKISFQAKDAIYLSFSLVTFIRAFVRVAGGMFGFIKFWIFRVG